MTTQSRNARIAFFSGLAAVFSAVILLASCPGANHWFRTSLARSMAARPLILLAAVPVIGRLTPTRRFASRKIRVRRHARSALFLTAPDTSSS